MRFLHLPVLILEKQAHGAMENADTAFGHGGGMTPCGHAISSRPTPIRRTSRHSTNG